MDTDHAASKRKSQKRKEKEKRKRSGREQGGILGKNTKGKRK